MEKILSAILLAWSWWVIGNHQLKALFGAKAECNETGSIQAPLP